ncbi:unnamed protein product [Auanema sp. JU1783]|nr:unnamed protein product [Auanema sp. JU1783]
MPKHIETEPPVVIWSRDPSVRSVRSGNRVLTGQYLIDETDTLCVMPSAVRLLCAVLTFLLIASVTAAVINSLQGNTSGSASYCKEAHEAFSPNVLCPRESMFFYYKCCDVSETEKNKCCAHVRIWLLFAIICVLLSCVIAITYLIIRYCIRCSQRKPYATEI